jgi:ATP-binding cassette subfamily F protein uup
MDRLVDHLFAFEGDGFVRDFPGNYSQYREFLKQQEMKEDAGPAIKEVEKVAVVAAAKKKLSFKEQREFEQLEKEMAVLEKEKGEIYSKLSDANLGFDKIQQLTARIGTISSLMEEKEMRWLEISENLD